MKTLRQIGAIAGRDLLVEWRTRDMTSTSAVLGLASIVLFNFAFDFGRFPFSSLGAPVLALAFVFTGTSVLARSFALERENRCLDGLLLAPVDRSVLYAGKLVANVLVLAALQGLLLVLGVTLLNQGTGAVHLDARRWAMVVAVDLLAAIGFGSVGTLFALMAERTRRGDVLLAVLQSIIGLPVLIASVLALRRIFDVAIPLSDVRELVELMAVFDVVFVAVALVVFEYVVED